LAGAAGAAEVGAQLDPLAFGSLLSDRTRPVSPGLRRRRRPRPSEGRL